MLQVAVNIPGALHGFQLVGTERSGDPAIDRQNFVLTVKYYAAAENLEPGGIILTTPDIGHLQKSHIHMSGVNDHTDRLNDGVFQKLIIGHF